MNTVILEEIKKAVGAHGAWKLKLKTAINMGKSDVSVYDISCDNKCAFGKWLYGPQITAEIRHGKPYQVIRRLHAEFHRLASQVLKLALENKKSEAMALLEGDYTEKSDKLIRALNKWRNELMH